LVSCTGAGVVGEAVQAPSIRAKTTNSEARRYKVLWDISFLRELRGNKCFIRFETNAGVLGYDIEIYSASYLFAGCSDRYACVKCQGYQCKRLEIL
jgi:hypothetical protein